MIWFLVSLQIDTFYDQCASFITSYMNDASKDIDSISLKHSPDCTNAYWTNYNTDGLNLKSIIIISSVVGSIIFIIIIISIAVIYKKKRLTDDISSKSDDNSCEMDDELNNNKLWHLQQRTQDNPFWDYVENEDNGAFDDEYEERTFNF